MSDGGIFHPSREPLPLFRAAQRLGAYKFAGFHHLVEHTTNTAYRYARRRELTTRCRHMFLHIVDHSIPRLPSACSSSLRPRRVALREDKFTRRQRVTRFWRRQHMPQKLIKDFDTAGCTMKCPAVRVFIPAVQND
ncbi:hypothetical protein HMPREF2998_05925 [Corynebacterium sp. HMSC065A05]|nr:hypothetical protein HMPREF2998_05925 [Corynebacterium sp. HMSC065A05]